MLHQRIKNIRSLYSHFGSQQHLTSSLRARHAPLHLRVYGFEVDIKERRRVPRPPTSEGKPDTGGAQQDAPDQTKVYLPARSEGKGDAVRVSSSTFPLMLPSPRIRYDLH